MSIPHGTHRRPRRPLALAVAGAAALVLITVAAVALWPGDGATPPVVAGSTPRPATTGPAGGSPTPAATASAPASTAAATPTSHRSSTGPTAAPAGQRLVTFVNALSQTLWVAGWQQTPQPALSTTGWVLPAGQRLTITVPDKWNGRFWGRTGCSFDASGKGHCETGDCAGRFQCRQYGAIPATLAEYNFNSWHNLDFYDVSLVDGSNVPMWINITRGGSADAFSTNGCTKAGCTKSVDCPTELLVNASGKQVGCISPCARFDTDQYCCRGQWAPRSACDPTKWPVDYAAIFKKAEPFAYSYVDDDATSTFTCVADCDYRITFGLTP
jgi:hypothetical protein